MAAYRFYCLDGEGRITFAEWIDARDDVDAVRKARDLRLHAPKCEVWQGKRLVATLNAREPPQ